MLVGVCVLWSLIHPRDSVFASLKWCRRNRLSEEVDLINTVKMNIIRVHGFQFFAFGRLLPCLVAVLCTARLILLPVTVPL